MIATKPEWEYDRKQQGEGVSSWLQSKASQNGSAVSSPLTILTSISKGERFGFLGPNGAGSSTTIDMSTD